MKIDIATRIHTRKARGVETKEAAEIETGEKIDIVDGKGPVRGLQSESIAALAMIRRHARGLQSENIAALGTIPLPTSMLRPNASAARDKTSTLCMQFNNVSFSQRSGWLKTNKACCCKAHKSW